MKKNNRPHFWQQPRFRYGGISTLILCLLLAALLGLNVLTASLEKKNGWKVDCSFNAVTTQSAPTREVLAALTRPVHIYALFNRGQEDAQLIEVLDRYAAASPLVTWEQTDVLLNPGLISRFQGATSDQTITTDSLIVSCEETGRWKVISPAEFISVSYDYTTGEPLIAGLTYESRITAAIRYVTQETVPRVLVLQGHGELDEDGTAVFAELLRSNNFDVTYFTLNDGDVTLTPGDLLAILSPVRDLTDDELETIADFAARGGSILFTCDYSDPIDRMPNVQSLMRSYGFLPKEGIVVASPEESGTYYNNNRICLIPYMQRTSVTEGLMESGADTLLLVGARAFETVESTDRNLTVLPALSSGYKAYLHDIAAESLDQQDGDEIGPFAMAMEAYRTTAEGNVSRAFILGCSTVLTSSDVHAMTDTQEFIIRMTEYLLDTEPIEQGIIAKAAIRPRLSVESTALGSVILVALPLAVLALALIVLLPRRHQ